MPKCQMFSFFQRREHNESKQEQKKITACYQVLPEIARRLDHPRVTEDTKRETQLSSRGSSKRILRHALLRLGAAARLVKHFRGRQQRQR